MEILLLKLTNQLNGDKMITAKSLSKTYIIRQKKNFFSKAELVKKEAVSTMDIDIPKGKIIGLLGINGAGKTTAIKMLSTMIEPTTGTIFIDNIDAIKYPMKAKTKINIITGGERNIYWRLTATENLQYFGSLYGLYGKNLKNQIDSCLKIVQLEEDANTPVEKFSKGMKQRLQIARGLINNPNYIFLDEPTLGLDILISKELKTHIKNLATENEKGLLLTTHYIGEAEELCDYIYIIDQGRIIAQGSPQDIKDQYTHKIKTQFVLLQCSDELLNRLRQIPGVLDISFCIETLKLTIFSSIDIVQEVILLSRKFDIKILNIQSIEPSLEDSLFSIMEQYHCGKEK